MVLSCATIGSSPNFPRLPSFSPLAARRRGNYIRGCKGASETSGLPPTPSPATSHTSRHFCPSFVMRAGACCFDSCSAWGEIADSSCKITEFGVWRYIQTERMTLGTRNASILPSMRGLGRFQDTETGKRVQNGEGTVLFLTR